MATRNPIKSINKSAKAVSADAAADKARKAASKAALKQQRDHDAKVAAELQALASPVPAAKPEPAAPRDHKAEYAANALAAAQADADATGTDLATILADMGLAADGTPLATPDEAKTGYVGPMLALVAARKHYTKAANGILCNGDGLALVCGAFQRHEVVAALGQLLHAKGLIASTNPYTHLNPGQQSMNLRNKARYALKDGAITMGDVRAAFAAMVPAAA